MDGGGTSETKDIHPRPPVVPDLRRWDRGGCQEGPGTEPEEVPGGVGTFPGIMLVTRSGRHLLDQRTSSEIGKGPSTVTVFVG